MFYDSEALGRADDRLLTTLRRFEADWWPVHGPGKILAALHPRAEAHAFDMVVDPWAEDDEHGLLHGLAAASWASAAPGYAPRPALDAACVVHDVARFPGDREHDHDDRLRLIFPDVDPAAYSHWSNPEPASPLVFGDRVELRRYPDWKDWVSAEVAAETIARPDVAAEVAAFYDFVRPALAQLWRHRHRPWLRHGVETDKLVRDTIRDGGGGRATAHAWGCYPRSWWHPPGAGLEQGFAAEVGALDEAFGNRLLADKDWVMGLMPLAEFRHASDAARGGLGRVFDHEVVSGGAFPTCRWTFLVADYPLLRHVGHGADVPPGGLKAVRYETAMVFLRVSRKLEAVLKFSAAASRRL